MGLPETVDGQTSTRRGDAMKNNFWVVGEWDTSVLVLDRHHVRIEVRGFLTEKTYDHILKSTTPWHLPKEISRHHKYAEARAMQKLVRAARGYK